MRSLMFLLVLVLFCSVLQTLRATIAVNVVQSVCCEGFTNKKIPLNRIVSYQWTTSDCPFKAIVFKTVAGKEICVDPEDTHVKRQINKMGKGTSSATTTTHASTFSKASGSTSATTTAASTAKTPQFK